MLKGSCFSFVNSAHQSNQCGFPPIYRYISANVLRQIDGYKLKQTNKEDLHIFSLSPLMNERIC